MRFELLQTVILNRDIPDHRLRRGDVGTVVEVYQPSSIEAEFVTGPGRTHALVTLSVDDVRPIGDRDLIAVRSLDEAP